MVEDFLNTNSTNDTNDTNGIFIRFSNGFSLDFERSDQFKRILIRLIRGIRVRKLSTCRHIARPAVTQVPVLVVYKFKVWKGKLFFD